MSSCLVLQQNKNIFIASDTAISSTVLGKRIRVSNSGEKVFTKDNNIIFCSGNVKLANKCKTFIMQMGEFDVAKLHSFLLEMNAHHTMFEVFIGMIGDAVKSYQLSSYNLFEPIERTVENNTEIFALGFNTKQMLQSFENNLSKTSVLEAFRNSYEENICNEVGGNVDIYYFYNGQLQKVSFDLSDKTECLFDKFDEEYLHYIMAEQLVGKVILGEQLYIGNGENTFKILPEGLYIYDNDASHSLRVFLGIDEDNKARLRLYSANGDNSLVLSEEGIYNCYQISDRDSFDYYNSFKSYFYIPNTLQRTFEAKLIVQLQPFRAYSKTSASGGKFTSTKTSAGGGNFNITSDTVSGGAYESTLTSKSSDLLQIGSWAGLTTSLPYATTQGGEVTAENHKHNVYGSDAIANHTHKVLVKVPAHSHNFNVSQGKHSHDVSIEIPAHTHESVYGIYEANSIPTVKVYMSGREIATLNSNTQFLEIDVTQWFDTLTKGSNTIEFKTTQTDGLARASFTLFWSGFYSYE